MFSGIIASLGIAMGKAFVLRDIQIEVVEGKLDQAEVEAEKVNFQKALKKTVTQLEVVEANTRENIGAEEADVFNAHIMIASDPEFADEVIDAIENCQPACAALSKVVNAHIEQIEQLSDPYLRSRITDIKDVSLRVYRNLKGLPVTSLAEIEAGSILVAYDLTPSDTSQLDLSKIWGLVTDAGGKTSHSSIIARSLELPAIVGAVQATKRVNSGDYIILDAINNQVLINPDAKTIAEYERRKREFEAEKLELHKFKHEPCITKDGKVFSLFANIGTSKDAASALIHGAGGIGLYRTEFLFMDRKRMPTEEEQFESYKEVAQMLKGCPVIIRTVDIGADKKLEYLDMPVESNPSLGCRGIRLCFNYPELLMTQLRAIYRASHFGCVKIMFPMAISVEECRKLKGMLEEVKTYLRNADIPFDEDLKVGLMIETPAAVMISDFLIQEVDFFSIGTNDLTQYILAVDRCNVGVADLYDYFSPSLLRAIQRVIACSHDAGKWTGMCGHMAGDERAALLLAGLGLDEFSVSAVAIPRIKKILRSKSHKELMALADKALQMATSGEVQALLDDVMKGS